MSNPGSAVQHSLCSPLLDEASLKQNLVPTYPPPLLAKDHHPSPPRPLRMFWASKVMEKGRGRERGSQLIYPDEETCLIPSFGSGGWVGL